MSIFFFKQKTAYEMRISDWSSDVCSSDLWSIRGPEGNPDARARRTEIVAVAAGIGAEKFELERAGVVPGGLRRGVEDRPGCGGRRAHEYGGRHPRRSEEHTSELQSLMRISYAVFCLKKKTTHINKAHTQNSGNRSNERH